MLNLRQKLCILLVCASCSSTFAQLTVNKEEIQWGESLEFTYDPYHEDAALAPGLPIYANILFQMEDHSEQRESIELYLQDSIYQGKLVIPKDVSGFYLTMKRGNFGDYDASKRISCLRADGKAARGASMMKGGKVLNRVEEELSIYPHNYAVYKDYWHALTFSRKEDDLDKIRQGINTLKSEGKENPEKYFALAAGHISLGEFEQGFTYFEKLSKSYPTSHLLYELEHHSQYNLFAKSADETTRERLNEIQLNYAQANPKVAPIRRFIPNYISSWPKEKLQDLFFITKHWTTQEPDNPIALLSMARALSYDSLRFEEAEKYADKALSIYLNPAHMRAYQLDWDYSLIRLSRVYDRIGSYSKALTILETQINQSREGVQGYVLEKAKVLQKLGHHERAMKSFAKAFQMGAPGTQEAITSFAQSVKMDEHALWKLLNAELKELDATTDFASAPSFAVKNLVGTPFDLSQLNGKVVVLNFWFVGCAPCHIEIPGLNELVKHYEGQEVVFLAFALNGEESLKKFLIESPFDYEIIPEAQDIANTYKVNGYPTHVIIDQEGKMRSTFTGGSKERHKDLIPMIDYLLSRAD